MIAVQLFLSCTACGKKQGGVGSAFAVALTCSGMKTSFEYGEAFFSEGPGVTVCFFGW